MDRFLSATIGACASLAISLMGCVPPPSGYEAESFFNGGYGETEVRPSVWNVYYHGTGVIKFETAEMYWLRRCADIARSRGYSKFAVAHVSEKRGNHSDPLVVEGTIELVNEAAKNETRRLLDVAAIEAMAVTPCNEDACRMDSIPGAKAAFPPHEN